MSRKDRNRQRRAVERQIEEAWQALDTGATDLAARLCRRAREAGSMNPRVLHDCGAILLRCGEVAEAEETLRAAIARAPNYADAFAALAGLLAGVGRLAAAVRLQARAAELQPGDELARRVLAELERRLRLEAGQTGVAEGGSDDAAPAGAVSAEELAVAERLRPVDLDAAAEALARRGACVLPGVATPEECAALRRQYQTGAGMEHEYAFPDGSRAAFYRWYLDPLPGPVAGLRAGLWPTALALASELRRRLDLRSEYPAHIAEWLAVCARLGRRRQAVRILRLLPGGAVPERREEDRAAFPLRAAVDLGGVDGGRGEPPGETVAVVDRRPGKKVRRHAASTRPGDAVLFCARERIDRVGGVYGLQPVAFGFGPFAGERLLLDLPFQGDG